MGAVQDRSRKTRTLLLDAAYRVFVREGFERAQIDTIAREAGRTMGAVYAHFRNKEHLFLALLEQRTAEAERRVDRLIGRDADASSALETLRGAVTELHDPAWAILNLELKLYALRHPRTAHRMRATFRRIHDEEGSRVALRLTERSRAVMASKLSALWSLVSAIVLDLNFDPDVMSRRDAGLLLGEVFDGLFRPAAELEPTGRLTPGAARRTRPTRAARPGAARPRSSTK